MSLKLFAVAMCGVVFGGCYGAQLVKGPINAEQAALSADSARADQRRLLREIETLRTQLAEDRLARMRYQASMNATMQELEESLRILISRMDDAAQRQSMAPGSRVSPRSQTLVTPPSVATNDSMPVDTTAMAVRDTTGGSEDDLYRAAYLDLTRGNFDLAIQGFQNYLVRYPAGGRVGAVHYYLGECYYSSERYLEAVGEFQYVVDKFPESRLVPAAFLKTGRCYWALGERRLAERAYRSLIDKHPDAEEAEQARAALEQIEG